MYRMHKLINRLLACCVYSIVPSQPLPVYASLFLLGTCQASIPSCMGDIDCSQSQRTSWVAKLSLKPLCVILVCILASLKYEVQSFKLKVSCNNFKLAFSKDTKLINNCDCCCWLLILIPALQYCSVHSGDCSFCGASCQWMQWALVYRKLTVWDSKHLFKKKPFFPKQYVCRTWFLKTMANILWAVSQLLGDFSLLRPFLDDCSLLPCLWSRGWNCHKGDVWCKL